MFSRIRDSVGYSVSVSRSYDYYSRQTAIDKIHAMSLQVGSPDILRDRKFLKLMYKDLLVQKTDFFQNILYGVSFVRKRQEHALVSPSEETRWLDNLLLTRVTYVPAANKVVVPEVLLQPPLFHPGFPPSVNLGGLGSMMAEAVVAGVAGFGSVYTATGRIMDGSNGENFTLSRSAEANAALKRPAQCLVNQWSLMRLDTPDHLEKCAIDSAVSVAGLEAAYSALGTVLSTEGGQLMPSLETLDPQAVFFLQYAQSFCSESTLRQRDLDRTVGSQLLGREKLKGVLSQFSDFSHYYFCSDSSETACGPLL